MVLPSLDQSTGCNGVVIAEKMLHKGSMFGHVSNGGGMIGISNNISIKFIAHNQSYVTLQIIHSGIGQPIKTQSWQKSKKVIEKKVIIKEVKPQKKVEDQYKHNENVIEM